MRPLFIIERGQSLNRSFGFIALQAALERILDLLADARLVTPDHLQLVLVNLLHPTALITLELGSTMSILTEPILIRF